MQRATFITQNTNTISLAPRVIRDVYLTRRPAGRPCGRSVEPPPTFSANERKTLRYKRRKIVCATIYMYVWYVYGIVKSSRV